MNRVVIFILAFLMPITAFSEKSTLNEGEFTLHFLERLKVSVPDSQFEVVANLRIHTKDISGYELNIFLDNAYDVYKSGTRDIDRVFEDQLASINNHKAAFSNSDVKSIFPVLKPGAYIDTAKKQLKETGYDKETLPFYFEKLNEDIYKMYVFDSQDSMRFVSPEDVEEYGIRETISSIASKNLEAYYEKIGAQVGEIDTKGNGRAYLFSADENYEASLLTAFAYLKQSLPQGRSEWVVFIPARNIALIVEAGDTKAIQLASNLAARAYGELGYTISPYGYIEKGGSWRRFEP